MPRLAAAERSAGRLRSGGKRLLGAMALALATLAVGSPAGAQTTWPLRCRGGGDMTFAISSGMIFREISIFFKAGTQPAGYGLLPGQCSWLDRGFRPGEPTYLCRGRLNTIRPVASYAWSSDRPFGSVSFTACANFYDSQCNYLYGLWSGGYVTFYVYNDGNGCMVPTNVP